MSRPSGEPGEDPETGRTSGRGAVLGAAVAGGGDHIEAAVVVEVALAGAVLGLPGGGAVGALVKGAEREARGA
ncbi:hypothetical protein ACQEVY_21550 [Streptomyces sp. CA-288835]|uniref:hypothetical protein n=1 Tax=Streptomyces sp. CA-288835 TaxID=3240069 RepID=UPI003D945F11